MTTTTGLILAGGAGRRVEGRDKGLLDWRGRPLIVHVAERLAPQVDRLLISCNRNFDQYAQIADLTAADGRRDFQGPLAGLEAAAASINSEYLAISACDTPAIPRDLVPRLLGALLAEKNKGMEIAFAHDGEQEQYLCAVIDCNCLASLPDHLDSGHRSVHRWYRTRRCIAVDFSDQAKCFENHNRLT